MGNQVLGAPGGIHHHMMAQLLHTGQQLLHLVRGGLGVGVDMLPPGVAQHPKVLLVLGGHQGFENVVGGDLGMLQHPPREYTC